jgi:hypothetical protein
MEEWIKELLKFSVGGLTIGGIVVVLGKIILTKGSDLLIENHKAQIEITKVEHQIKFTKLHEHRAEIIKSIYQDFYDFEIILKRLSTLYQGPKWTDNDEKVMKALNKFEHIRDFLEYNRIYFSQDLCNKLKTTLTECNEITMLMLKAKGRAETESIVKHYKFSEGEGSKDLWTKANDKTDEIRILRLELASEFRELIGV